MVKRSPQRAQDFPLGVPADFALFKSDVPILLPYRDPKTSGGSREKELPEGAHVKAPVMIESLEAFYGLISASRK
jgi:hypothetical protein